MKDLIKSKAIELGFSAVGITSADPVGEAVHLEEAIGGGRTAEMGWLARNPEARCDPRSLLPGARSVVCCAFSYGDEGIHLRETRETRETRDTRETRNSKGRARFARGADYHVVVKEKLEGLWKAIQERMPDARSKICVDTSPILEKALAARAGLGWIGKHTVLLNRKLGSWFVLGEIITDIEIESDPPASNMCGECRKCIDACPTSAIAEPQELDARKCISYLTIEAPRVNSPGLEGSYGCDLCQEACPYNC